jgi:Raf kinase inhibitor-like YbhB/YbcL family protein
MRIFITCLLCLGCFASLSLNAQEGLMKIATTAFEHEKPIPPKFTCQGVDVSPPLSFSNTPAGTKSFALIVDDPDAPRGTWVHWVAWNIPGDSKGLAEGGRVPNQGKNDFQENRYRGPCPPPGKPHRYFFKLYALDTTLSLPEDSSKGQLESAMEGHILAKAELIGTFKR